MYDHIFYKQVQITRSDIRPHIKWAVSLVILHMVTSIFLQGLCGYIWVNILTLSPQRPYNIVVSFKLKCVKCVTRKPLIWIPTLNMSGLGYIFYIFHHVVGQKPV